MCQVKVAFFADALSRIFKINFPVDFSAIAVTQQSDSKSKFKKSPIFGSLYISVARFPKGA